MNKIKQTSLEEAAEKYRRESCNKAMLPNIDGPMPEYGGSIKDAFIAGAEWQKKHSFKPTQEHLDALDSVYKTHGADSACRHILLNLLNQLKELL